MIPLPLVPVIAASLVPLIVGAVWYHPGILGTRWMSYKHITPAMADRASKLSVHTTAVMIVLGVVTAFMLSRILYALDIHTYSGGLITAASLWVGFVVPATISRVLWDHAPLALYVIETGQWLVSFCIMSLVLLS